MITVLRQILEILTPRERRVFAALMGIICIMGLLEAIGTAAIVPFLSMIAAPEIISQTPLLAWLYDLGSFNNDRDFLIASGWAVFAIVVFSMAFKALTIFMLTRFSLMRNYTISARLLAGYLHQPYEWFLQNHTADISKTVLSEVDTFVGRCLLPVMHVLAHLITILFVSTALFFLEPGIALAAAGLMGGSYVLIFLAMRKALSRAGEGRAATNSERFQVAQEATGGVKELKLMGLENTFVRRFRDPARRMAVHQTWGLVLGQLPRYALEAIAFGGMIVLSLALLIRDDGSIADLLPTFGLLAVAGARLFPAMQRLFQSMTSIRFARPALEALHTDIKRLHVPPTKAGLQSSRTRIARRFGLTGVTYHYPTAEHPTLRDFSLTIEANSTIGLVGGTGAGKTTIIDLLLGLLEPEEGNLCIDDVPVTPLILRNWQRAIGYVPQQIFLSNTTIASNIAFGQQADQIDMEAVIRAARIAELHDFVAGELADGYQSQVGERGVRLSGGQRQRIGIARALYHDPDVLIFDEATAALDNLTERAVMSAMANLSGQKTLIMVAHRLSTVRNCDCIYLLERGQILDSGNYDDLLAGNATFRAMVGGGG